MCFVTLLERDLLIQYLHAKTFLHGACDHIIKVVDTYIKKKKFEVVIEDLQVWGFLLYLITKLIKPGNSYILSMHQVVICAVFYTKSLGFPITH